MGGVDPYTLLGVRSDASIREIRRAFRRLARQHHPAVNSRPDGPQRFAELAHAYAILNDPARRARYDQTLQQPAPTRPPAMSRARVPHRTLRRGIIELSPGEARHLARHPLTLRDEHGILVVLPAGAGHGDEVILLYDGDLAVLTVKLRGKT